MTFDESISETVSLSRILDCFVEDRESCSVIFSFLEKYKSDIRDILSNSKCRHRIFSIDFLARCTSSEVFKLYDIIKNEDVDEITSSYLAWQVMQSNLSSDIKTLFRNFVNVNSRGYQHPYHGRIGNEASRYDVLWKNADVDIEKIAEAYNRMSPDNFLKIMKTLPSSLWVFRFLQKDVFELLETGKQWIVVNNLHGVLFDLDYFYRQIFSAQIDLEIKKALFDTFINKSRQYIPWTKRTMYSQDEMYCKLPTELKNEVDNSESYAQIAIKMTLFGMDNYMEDVIMYLMYKRRFEYLVSFLDFGYEELKNNYDICDLLEWLKGSRHLKS